MRNKPMTCRPLRPCGSVSQVGRKIVTAVWEHITYNEFLPRILGWNAMQLYDLRVGTEGFFKGEP